MRGGQTYFWLGASADAASRPCGECPLRKALGDAGKAILKIPMDEAIQGLDRAYDIIWKAL